MDVLPLVHAGVRVIGWALLHFVWQGALLGLVYAVVRVALPRGKARYRFGMGVLGALAACPLLTAWRLLEAMPSVDQSSGGAVALTVASGGVTGFAWTWDTGLDALLPWLVLAWSSGVLLLSLRAWRQWRGLKILVRAAELMPVWQGRLAGMADRFGLRRRVTVLCSRVIGTPVLVGWIRPVILLPMAVACTFPVAQVELILAHELAHLRRWDPLANLFQVALETLHFYHPVVHWISRDVRNEREICCDELALSVSGGSRHEFVAALAELGELRERHGSLLLAATGGVLLDRVQHMVVPVRGSARVHTSARFVAALLGVGLIALTLQLEWKQAQLQRSLADASTQLQSMLAPPWQPLTRPRSGWHLVDLVPAHVKVARLLESAPVVLAKAHPVVSPMDVPVAAVLSRLPPLRVVDLAPVRDGPRARLVNPRMADQAAPFAAPMAPTAIRIRQPVYPRIALTHGVEGQVVVEFGLAADGDVQDLHVVSAQPAGVFDQAAVQAMRGWKYALPAAAAAQRRYRQTMVFMLDAAAGRSASGAYAGEEIRARVGCQIVTGTHICRWPDEMGPSVTTAAGLAKSH